MLIAKISFTSSDFNFLLRTVKNNNFFLTSFSRAQNLLRLQFPFLDQRKPSFTSDSYSIAMSDITQERRDFFQLLNGDIFYPISVWPQDIKLLFWKKPIGDTDTFKLLLFFLGNGCSPDIISQWILTSQYWADHKKADKRARQISFIRNNLTSKGHIWFYYDIHHSEWLFLNGEKRLLNNQ